QQLGAGPRAQALSALFCATIPMGILQATSTQNDYVLAFWLVCLAFTLLAALAEPANPLYLIGVGASLGLALLTKGTAYVLVGPPLLIFFLIPLVRRR